MIHLIAPTTTNPYTGGHLVNAKLCADPHVDLASVRTLGELLASRPQMDSLRNADAIVVDSLFLSQADPIRELRLRTSCPVGLIAHSLPSLIPEQDTGARRLALECERAAAPYFDFVVSPSRFIADRLERRGFDRRSISVVQPAPVTDGRTGTPAERTGREETAHRHGPVRILTVANWSRFKGIDVVRRALVQIESLDWRWVIAGAWQGTAFGETLHRRITGSSLGRRVRVCGLVAPEEMATLYREADLFVLPSTMESYGLASVEAMTHGAAVLVFSAAACPEVLGDGAVLVRVGDFEGFVQAIRNLVGDRNTLSDAAARARRTAETLPTWSEARAAFIAATRRTRAASRAGVSVP